ncbi:Precorrin-6y C5,15-methyltransferase (Decarboxylating), CbiE subunit,precorrin-6Y C5,15-methyltransferase (Decarboxylating), CbiT subunit [Hyella patelloides LEGE 07179]|uniref:Glucose-inhibited division protein B n=1 Tax=Hyella patelloides LEGE 07179 TaxID=945734 RepID=A0A563W0U5_9CYAN|nr:precorrin-6y C5,15-methyltransferase (decarboxylating) subunit CbiE [Hyella patelloides]VEP17265.1 Precorrin-6y C5,15-methyltransferase (Decarboxylating), CbiE subunit,precorrin-6Y C5,15-methyltransferase (Decarboxylating), CbiT subunit [Hyella patelloides LEGE 07179]
MNQIDVVGIDLDGKSELTDTATRIIEQATILSGAKRHLSYFSKHPAVKIPLNNLQQDIELLIEKATTDKIVILASGDPLFFGLGRLLLSKIPLKKLQFYPHLSSIQLAFSKLKIPWQDSALISVHGRDCDELIKHLKQGTNKIAVLTDSFNNPIAIAKLYDSLELTVAYSFHICENLTLENGEITSFSPQEITALAKLPQDRFAALNVLVLIRENLTQNNLNLANLPLFGISDSAFLSFSDRPNLITKKEVRSVILAELALQSQQTVWDLGAGTGSVSIEIARLCPTAKIYAIEKTAMGISLIKQNCQRFAVKNIQPISAKAPESLAELPTPDRIFIGGSGGNLISILNTCQSKIAPQGIIVITLATIEHFAEVLQWAKQNNWHYHLLQVQISRSIPIANLTRFSPLNPITIIKLVN